MAGSLHHLRIRITDRREVGRPGPRVQVAEERIVERGALELRDLAIRIVDVAEDNRLGRASRLTCRQNVAVVNRSSSLLGIDPGSVDPLDTVGALFHHPALADGDVWIVQQFEARSRVVGILVKVEATDLPGAVVRAIPGTNAAVVYHVVQAFVAVNGGSNRTNQLTWSILTLHAGNRLGEGDRIRGVPLIITVDPNPMHDPLATDLILTDNGNIVFGLAGDLTRLTANAGAQVDRHPPCIARISHRWVQRAVWPASRRRGKA